MRVRIRFGYVAPLEFLFQMLVCGGFLSLSSLLGSPYCSWSETQGMGVGWRWGEDVASLTSDFTIRCYCWQNLTSLPCNLSLPYPFSFRVHLKVRPSPSRWGEVSECLSVCYLTLDIKNSFAGLFGTSVTHLTFNKLSDVEFELLKITVASPLTRCAAPRLCSCHSLWIACASSPVFNLFLKLPWQTAKLHP